MEGSPVLPSLQALLLEESDQNLQARDQALPGLGGQCMEQRGDAGLGSGVWELRLPSIYRGIQLGSSKLLPDLQVSQQNLGKT